MVRVLVRQSIAFLKKNALNIFGPESSKSDFKIQKFTDFSSEMKSSLCWQLRDSRFRNSNFYFLCHHEFL